MSDVIVDGLSYPVIVSGNAPARVAALIPSGADVAVVYDARVKSRARMTAQAMRRAGATILGELALRGGERVKNARALEQMWRWLLGVRADRRAVLVAIGGGTITDLAGLAAATYMRGIAWIAVPTTVLGMADAAIGGKTAIDLPEGKNLAGAFWPPLAVVADMAALATLPARERSTGIAEIVKAAIIGDPPLLDAVTSLPSRPDGTTAWRDAVAAAARVKVGIVASDPRESGARAALNLGHTLGHAIEHASRHGVSHGRAVSVGLRASGLLALRKGLFSAGEHAKVLRALKHAALPLHYGALDQEAILRAMQADKKRRDGTVRFVLPQRIGRVLTGEIIPDKDLRAVVAQCASPPETEELGE